MSENISEFLPDYIKLVDFISGSGELLYFRRGVFVRDQIGFPHDLVIDQFVARDFIIQSF